MVNYERKVIMSINENQEFEAINQKTRERNDSARAACYSTEEIYRGKAAKARKKAIMCMVAITAAFMLAIWIINILETIGWINSSFKVLMMVAAGCVSMFNLGYYWHELKK